MMTQRFYNIVVFFCEQATETKQGKSKMITREYSVKVVESGLLLVESIFDEIAERWTSMLAAAFRGESDGGKACAKEIGEMFRENLWPEHAKFCVGQTGAFHRPYNDVRLKAMKSKFSVSLVF